MLIQEEFVSYQGSGALLGRRQYFVRFAGCEVKCPIRDVCDQPEALLKRNGYESRPQEVIDRAIESVGAGGWLHITGGEPLNQPRALLDLCDLAKKSGLRTHLQTSGTIAVPVPFDFITLSPKAIALQQVRSHEMILVFDPRWVNDEVAMELYTVTNCFHYYLMPLERDGVVNAMETVEFCEHMANQGQNWRITVQAHKTLGVA